MAFCVNDSNHFNPVVLDIEEDLVRKPTGENAPHVPVEHEMMERISGDGVESGVDFSKKFAPKAGLTLFVPVESLHHVGLGFGPDEDAMAHFRREMMRA
jgi:hypothetical protein